MVTFSVTLLGFFYYITTVYVILSFIINTENIRYKFNLKKRRIFGTSGRTGPKMISKQSVETLSDLIENRLAMMMISDQDDLREKVKLQRALQELQTGAGLPAGVLKEFAEIPRRGRRRKIAGLGGL